jgi:hypothetical protein
MIMNCKKLGNVFAVMAILITCLALPSYAGGFLKKMIKLEKQQSQSTNSSQQEGNFAVGDEYAGGIIFYIDDSGNHGLVASDTDIRGTRSWDEAMISR